MKDSDEWRAIERTGEERRGETSGDRFGTLGWKQAPGQARGQGRGKRQQEASLGKRDSKSSRELIA